MFYAKKARSRQYQAGIITDVDYTDDLAILANTPAQTESQLHGLEQTTESIGFHVNVNKPEYVRFKQEGTIST